MPFQRMTPPTHAEDEDQHEKLQEPARSMYGLTAIAEAEHRAYHESRGESADHSHDGPEDEHVYNDTDDEWDPQDEDPSDDGGGLVDPDPVIVDESLNVPESPASAEPAKRQSGTRSKK